MSLLKKRNENLEQIKKDVDLKITSYSLEVKENLVLEIHGLQNIIEDLKNALDSIRNKYKEETKQLSDDYHNKKEKVRKEVEILNHEINSLWEEKKKALEPIQDEYGKLELYRTHLNDRENNIIIRENEVLLKAVILEEKENEINMKDIFLNEKEIQVVKQQIQINDFSKNIKIDYDKFIKEKTEFEEIRQQIIDESNTKLNEARSLKELSEKESTQNVLDKEAIRNDRLHLQSQIDNFNKHGKR